MRHTLLVLAALLVLTACDPRTPTPTPEPVDLTPITTALDALTIRVTVLQEQVSSVTEGITALDGFTREQLANINDAAKELDILLRQPIDLGNVNWNGVQLLEVATAPELLNFLVITPGDCPEELPTPRIVRQPGEVLISMIMPAPTGPHCIIAPDTETTVAFGVYIDIPPGTYATVSLLPPYAN